MGLLSIEPVALALKSRIMQATAGPAGRVFSQAGRSPALDEWIVDFARDAIQPGVRARAYRCLFDGRMVWTVGRKWRWTDVKWGKGRFEPVFEERLMPERADAPAILRAAMLDQSPIVRRVAADVLIERLDSFETDAPIFAELLAADSSSYVAECGRFALRKLAARSGAASPADPPVTT